MESRQTKTTAVGKSSDDKTEASRHLSNIDKLLGAAYDLMKQTPELDAIAFEQLRQLRVRLRRSIGSSEKDHDESLPKTAPELFKNRPEGESAVAFTKRVYSKWLGRNLCRSDVQKLDVKLYNALYNLENPTEIFREIGLLTKKELNDRLLASAGPLKGLSASLSKLDLGPAERERTRLYNLARRRKQRPTKS